MSAAPPTELKHALQAQRVTAGDWAGGIGLSALGGLGYGLPGDGASLGGLPVPLLGGSAACVDAWLGGPALQRGRSGAARWCHDGHWLHGVLDIDDAEEGLADAAQAAYRDVFATLHDSGFAHLLRLWNYLPRINAESSGLERYRRFNIGRQEAFIAAGHSAFEGAPAACAIGTASGALRVRFLAARQAPLAVENPRQVSAYRYPSQYGPRAPTFSRAALASAGGGRVALFVSGTASIVGHETQHAGDVRAQTRETVANLRAVVAAAQARCSAPLAVEDLACCIYVRHAADQPAVLQELASALGVESVALRSAVQVQADICRADLLVEVEGHLFTPGSLLP